MFTHYPINRLSAFYCSEEAMSQSTDMQLTGVVPPSPQAPMPPTEDVTALPHEIDRSPSSTPPPKQRKQCEELKPAPWPLPDPPPRAVVRSSASSEVSQIDTEEVAIPSLRYSEDGVTFADDGRAWTPSDSEEVTVTESAFLENESPSSSENYKKKITTVKKITKSKPAPMRMLRPPLPTSPQRFFQFWSCGPELDRGSTTSSDDTDVCG